MSSFHSDVPKYRVSPSSMGTVFGVPGARQDIVQKKKIPKNKKIQKFVVHSSPVQRSSGNPISCNFCFHFIYFILSSVEVQPYVSSLFVYLVSHFEL